MTDNIDIVENMWFSYEYPFTEKTNETTVFRGMRKHYMYMIIRQ